MYIEDINKGLSAVMLLLQSSKIYTVLNVRSLHHRNGNFENFAPANSSLTSTFLSEYATAD